MSNRKIAIATAVAAAAGFSTAALADDSTSAELDSLKARIAEIESQQHQSAINATVADAQSRNELLKANGFTAGWDDGFKLGSGDGNYSMQIYALLQIRNITTANGGFFFEDNDDDGDESEDQTINGFEIARTQVGLRGTIIDPRLGYNIRSGFGHSGGGDLQLAYMTWQAADEWTIKVGQYFANWTQERNLGDGKVMAVDRSLLNATLGGDVTGLEQGVAAMYVADNMRGEFGFTDGASSGNTPWNGEEPTGYDFGVTGRFEFKFNGDWASYDDFSALGNDNDLFVLGGGFDWSSGADYSDGDGYDLRHTIDVQWENTAGLSLYAAYIGDFSDIGDDDVYHWGAMGQVAYLFGDSKWEVFGRYSYVNFDEDVFGDDDSYQEVTGGVNYYFFNSHAFKFTCDLNFLPDGIYSDFDNLGYVPDDDEVWSLRAQLQLEI